MAVTLVLSLGGYFLWTYHHQKQLTDGRYQILNIVQTGPEKEALTTAYLAELLNLSIDKPVSLYAFDCKKGEKQLALSPLIAKGNIKKHFDHSIYIDYTVRKTIARLADYKNIGIDKEGYLFPIAPFFSPKEIPEIYLGLPSFGASEDSFGRKGGGWLIPVQNRFFTLAMEVLTFLEEAPWREGFRVKRIDVSNAFAPSLGQREIVLTTEEEIFFKEGIVCVFPKLLRLAPKDYPQQLKSFCALRRNMEADYKKQLASVTQSTRFTPRIVDLRIPHLAFVDNR